MKELGFERKKLRFGGGPEWAYRDAAALNVNKRVTHDVDVGLLGDAVTSVAMRLVDTFRPPELKVIEASRDDA